MSRVGLRWLVAGLAFMALLAWSWLPWQQSAAPPPDATDASQPKGSARAPADQPGPERERSEPARSGAAPALRSGPSSPLPAAGTPLAQAYDALALRARTGDAAAALRLFREVSRCSQGTAGVTFDTRTAEGRMNELRHELLQCERAILCQAASSEHLRNPGQWLLQAAEAGDADARLWFVAGFHFLLPDLDALGLLPRWREVAIPWLQEAAESGIGDAMLLLAEAYIHPDGIGGNLLGDLVPQDPVLALAWFQLWQGRDSTFAPTLAEKARMDAASRFRLEAAELRRNRGYQAAVDAPGRAAAARLANDLQARIRPLDVDPQLRRERFQQALGWLPGSAADIAARMPQCLDGGRAARLRALAAAPTDGRP